ncbi:uncharacterized protein LOC127842227 [Dreissena polymorpha]|uniref:Uncharacterized protein n=1 Tax=Dreissena polymorpha TaxID=45954 RepID=A0A9D4ESX2_DREPO|nr:uncharacterized protein LOC127842227 [Dreissena polymorpha]KAH3783435.1 hypothetical protein DPMN_161373 [Dreissena polymorpha]
MDRRNYFEKDRPSHFHRDRWYPPQERFQMPRYDEPPPFQRRPAPPRGRDEYNGKKHEPKSRWFKDAESVDKNVWVLLEDFQCPSKECPSKKPFKWRCLKDDEPVFLSQLGVIKCQSELHRGDLSRWGWNCGSEYHKGEFFHADVEGFTFALSQAVQLMARMGSEWVQELIGAIGKQYHR